MKEEQGLPRRCAPRDDVNKKADLKVCTTSGFRIKSGMTRGRGKKKILHIRSE